ncbi:MAG: hypothetical protein MR051_02530 [Lentisphaeria bacterium]|nr:hypothetical protein [Lentisphaeria bacterium]
MKKFIAIFILALLLTGSTGCGKPHRRLPADKLALTVRFFRSIEAADPAAAARQGRKLYAMDPRQDFILRLISIQESNEAVGNAQKLIRQGRINEALPIVAAAAKQYSHNRTLVSTYPKLTQLRNAETLLAAMNRARTASAMRGARIAARAGLSRNLTPSLKDHLAKYEKLEQDTARKENEKLQDAGKKAADAARQSMTADRQREEAEQKFQQNTSEKTAEGERVRRDAGSVPFEPSEQPAEKPEK